MADKSAIEWTDSTWNPTAGCSVVSPGCTNCYAMKVAARHEAQCHGLGRISPYEGLTRATKAGPVWTGEVRLNERALDLPLRWKKPRRIFVNSMSDLFHEALPDAAIDRVFAVMALAPQHTFQVLTKRAGRMRELMGEPARRDRVEVIVFDWLSATCGQEAAERWYGANPVWPLRNCWLGVSVEDQARADERIPELLATPAAVRFISAEPLLGPVDLRRLDLGNNIKLDALTGYHSTSIPLDGFGDAHNKLAVLPILPVPTGHIDWVIAGGESGPGARPMHPDWARSLRDQCSAAGIAYFFKQWGEWTPGENVTRHTGRVETADLIDERWSFGRENLASDDGHRDDEPELYRVGKKAAGRRLDGRTHDEFPMTEAEAETLWIERSIG